MTVEHLTEYGANTADGIRRCMNMPDFYLRMVGMIAKDDHLKKLRSALDARDLNTAFEEAHALKGVLANLEMTPVLTPITEITELLRARKDMDYDPLLEKAEQEMAKLLALING